MTGRRCWRKYSGSNRSKRASLKSFPPQLESTSFGKIIGAALFCFSHEFSARFLARATYDGRGLIGGLKSGHVIRTHIITVLKKSPMPIVARALG